ncbi:MAG: stage II sporulation protein M [Gammaproteobacteria bacterium]
MTPLQFEQLYQDGWAELEGELNEILGKKSLRKDGKKTPVNGERLAELYRRACEHLALARARAYPAYLQDRLDRLTAEAHQVIYQHRGLGFSRITQFFAADFPRAVRAHAVYVWISIAVFALPTIVIGFLVYSRPELILSVVNATTASSYEQMYSPDAESIGRNRTADTDWAMFGFYIRNNVTVSFQCFAGGLFAGLGSLFFLAYNGVQGGAVAGYLTERGMASTFYSFVATHSAFELTAIILSGAAGLRIGHAVLAPKRQKRVQALVTAARESIVIVYGFAVMLLIAAAIEAFWSSASWLPHAVKYSVAAACWFGVICYFVFQGRRAD